MLGFAAFVAIAIVAWIGIGLVTWAYNPDRFGLSFRDFLGATLVTAFEFISVGVVILATLTVMVLALGALGLLPEPAEASGEEVHHTTINRVQVEELEPFHKDVGKFAEERDIARIRQERLEERIENALDKTGFTSLSMDDQIRVVYFAGLLTEQAGKVTPNVGLSSFAHSALRQFGVQLQVAAMHRKGIVSNNPGIAFLQGFSVGL